MEQFEGSNYFLYIPAKVAHDTRFKSFRSIILYGEISSILNVTNKCFLSNKKLAERLNCTERTIQKCLQELKSLGYIETKNIVDPESGAVINREIYFPTDVKKQSEEIDFTGEVSHSSGDGRTTGRKPGEPQFAIIEHINKTNNRTNIYSSAEPEPVVNDKPKKQKPKKQVQQVQKWVKHEDAIKEIIDYLNAKLGTNYSPTTKETVNFIKQDFEKGHGVYDLKQVIDNMYDAWIGTDMFKYMRPSTLFRPSHVENYLNQGQLQKQNKAKRPVAFGGFVKRKTEPSPTELSQVHQKNYDYQQKQNKVSPETLDYLDNAFKDLEGDDADDNSR